MKCKIGDSIHSENIVGYKSLLERVDFYSISDTYCMGIDDIKKLYSEMSEKVYKIYGICSEKLITDYSSINKSNGTLSIVIKRKSYYDYVSHDTQAVRIATMIQDLLMAKYGNIKYLASISKILRSNLYKIGKAYLKPYYSGYCIIDMEMCCYNNMLEVENYLNSVLYEMNKHLQSCSIESICICNELLKPSDTQLMIGRLKRSIFKDLVERYQEWYSSTHSDKVSILEQDVRASIHLMLINKDVDKELINFKIAQRNDEWIIGFHSSLSISPYLIIKKLYPKVKINEIYHNSEFMVAGIYKGLDKMSSKGIEKDSRRCSCGNDLVYDLVRKKVSRVCPECQMKLLMSNYINIK